MKTELVKIDKHNRKKCEALSVTKRQQEFICANAISLMDAESNQGVAEAFGIYAGSEMVGLVITAFDRDYEDAKDRYWIWRFMIDETKQRQGYGSRALHLAVKYLQDNGAEFVRLSVSEANIGATAFLRKNGFHPTGIHNDDEMIFEYHIVKKKAVENTVEAKMQSSGELGIKIKEAAETEEAPVTEIKLETVAEAKVGAGLKAKEVSVTMIKLETVVETKVGAEPEAEAEAEAEADNETESITEGRPAVKNGLLYETNSEREVKTEIKTKAETEEKPETKAKKEINEKPETKAKKEINEKPETKPEPNIEEKPETNVGAETNCTSTTLKLATGIDGSTESDEAVLSQNEGDAVSKEDENSGLESKEVETPKREETSEPASKEVETPKCEETSEPASKEVEITENEVTSVPESKKTAGKKKNKGKKLAEEIVLPVLVVAAILWLWSYGHILENRGYTYTGIKPCSTIALALEKMGQGMYPWEVLKPGSEYAYADGYLPTESDYLAEGENNNSNAIDGEDTANVTNNIENNQQDDMANNNSDSGNDASVSGSNDATDADNGMDEADGNDEPQGEDVSDRVDNDDSDDSDGASGSDSTDGDNEVSGDGIGDDASDDTFDNANPFVTVDDSYFDDALFIGDSRMVGVSEYAGLNNATFYGKISMNIFGLMNAAPSTAKVASVRQGLTDNKFGKIYIMVGINEIGTGDTAYFISHYKEVVDEIRQLQPDAIIFIQGILHVSYAKSSTDRYFNNSNIDVRNNALSELANNRDIFYIDVNPVFDDQFGNLKKEYTFDNIHLYANQYAAWHQFYLEHGVKVNSDKKQGKETGSDQGKAGNKNQENDESEN